ncbi:craniofacial development protein 2-like [Plakobranchus ocellatus]|uniref:Craniofacial development protein 2-like n=1 Tax=Plakobranchus ocellatus TaxID=259542 RepID=A0AAV4DF42_9GAST|nr:craniofacial development protein 2-like [Plakobranchus ocellatus]
MSLNCIRLTIGNYTSSPINFKLTRKVVGPRRPKNKTRKGRKILTKTTAIHRSPLPCGLVVKQRLEDVVGPSGIGNVNECGSKLIKWCQINDFAITNIWYQNHPKRQWTWKSPWDRKRNKINYIHIKKRFRNASKHRNHCREPSVIQIIIE